MEVWLIVVIIIAAVIALALAAVAAVLGAGYLTRHRESADLARFLQGADCQWESLPTSSASAQNGARSFLYRNAATEASGIEMRVYYYPPGPEGTDEDGICLSIIDPENTNGMILNGFHHQLGAMQFGDQIWNERFLHDAGIMERIITEKRAEWDQMQREIIIAHSSLFM